MNADQKLEAKGTLLAIGLVAALMAWFCALDNGWRWSLATLGSVAIYLSVLVVGGLWTRRVAPPERLSIAPFIAAAAAATAFHHLLLGSPSLTRLTIDVALGGLMLGAAHFLMPRVWRRIIGEAA
jgi:hypothetical protein